ncbi:TPA: hypothetical protein ACNHTT_004664, partial [Escherichia coli]
ALFVPSVAVTLKAAVDFVRSPVGTVAAAIVGGLVLYGAGYVSGDMEGTDKTRAAWRAANVEADLAAKRRDALIKAKVAADADAASARLESDDKITDQGVSENEKPNPGRPECRATGDDIRRLLSIR